MPPTYWPWRSTTSNVTAVPKSTTTHGVPWNAAAAAAFALYRQHRGERPVSAMIYTHSHIDHFGGVKGVISQDDVDSGRVPVIAGAGSNSTKEAVELAQHAEKAGASAVLIVTPYYNKPTQEGMYQHFKAINDAINIPIIIYNIPPRSVIDMSVDTMKRLFDCKNIAGVKDATASMVRVSQQRAAMGEDFNQLSGEDATIIGYMAHGGHGCISVTSNVAPRLCSEFHVAWQKGDLKTALKLHDAVDQAVVPLLPSPPSAELLATIARQTRADPGFARAPLAELLRAQGPTDALVEVCVAQKVSHLVLAGGLPPRGASRSMPGRPDFAKRLRHKHTAFMPVFMSAAISWLSWPSAAASTIFARSISRAGVLLPRAHFALIDRLTAINALNQEAAMTHNAVAYVRKGKRNNFDER